MCSKAQEIRSRLNDWLIGSSFGPNQIEELISILAFDDETRALFLGEVELEVQIIRSMLSEVPESLLGTPGSPPQQKIGSEHAGPA